MRSEEERVWEVAQVELADRLVAVQVALAQRVGAMQLELDCRAALEYSKAAAKAVGIEVVGTREWVVVVGEACLEAPRVEEAWVEEAWVEEAW